MKFTFLRTLALIGGFITLAFGIWHSIVPWLYRWFDYMPSIPDELMNAILATNFFLAVTLVLLGLLTIVTAIWQWHNLSAVKTMLWGMSLLWVIRAGYQIISPQGTMISGLSISLAAIFGITALLFLIPSIMFTRNR